MAERLPNRRFPSRTQVAALALEDRPVEQPAPATDVSAIVRERVAAIAAAWPDVSTGERMELEARSRALQALAADRQAAALERIATTLEGKQ